MSEGKREFWLGRNATEDRKSNCTDLHVYGNRPVWGYEFHVVEFSAFELLKAEGIKAKADLANAERENRRLAEKLAILLHKPNTESANAISVSTGAALAGVTVADSLFTSEDLTWEASAKENHAKFCLAKKEVAELTKKLEAAEARIRELEEYNEYLKKRDDQARAQGNGDIVRVMEREMSEMGQELSEATEVIEFYGDEKHWDAGGTCLGDETPLRHADSGKRARAFLAKFPKAQGQNGGET